MHDGSEDFEQRVAATVPPETLFLHVYFQGDHGSMTELVDGRILLSHASADEDGPLASMSSSVDGGATWSASEPLRDREGRSIPGDGGNLVKLNSGGLGLMSTVPNYSHRSGQPPLALWQRDSYSIWFTRSDDEGRTWSSRVRVSEPGVDAVPLHDAATVTSSGRIVLPVYHYVGQRDIVPEDAGRCVALRGDELVSIQGHDYENAMDFCWVYYSDDEGETWQRNEDGTMIVTLDYSAGGHYSCEESVVAEVSPGHLLLVHRTPMGRLYQSWSSDDGSTWSLPEPTGLAASRAPASLKRIPGTEDLLIVWSQASAEEIHGGVGRHRQRLSAAISQDGGVTWKHHKSVRAPEGDGTTRVEPPPIQYYRSWKHAPRLPLRLPYSSYPAVGFWQDRVIITFYAPGPDAPAGRRGVCLGLPLSWFYG